MQTALTVTGSMDIIPSESVEYTLESYFVRVSPGSRIIYWIIIGAVTLSLAALPLIYVDVSVQARGYFQSDIEKQVINSPFDGRVIYSSVRTGKEVEMGDTLLIIDSETIRSQNDVLVKEIEENDRSMGDLKKLVSLTASGELPFTLRLATPRYNSEYASFSKLYLLSYQKFKKTQQEHNRNTVLHDQKLIADADFEASQYTFNNDRENLGRTLLLQKAAWQTDLTQRKNDSVSLEGNRKRLEAELENRIVTSPVSGEIIRSSEIQKGSFVLANQNITEISPEGDLFAVCYVKPSDIGLIHENQPVIIQVDAFNHNEWGMLKGAINDISDDMITDNSSGAFFRIKCRLDSRHLSLRNGYEAEMKKGMSLTARMIVTRRSLFNLLFDKMDKWFNPYMSDHKKISLEN
jgi:membrane fusion protein, peptide pheromone/bacteriocin exporter